jgi:hypothetical protein
MDLNPISYYNPIFAPPPTKILHPPMDSDSVEMSDGYEYSDRDEMAMGEGLDENRWDDAEELYDDSK